MLVKCTKFVERLTGDFRYVFLFCVSKCFFRCYCCLFNLLLFQLYYLLRLYINLPRIKSKVSTVCTYHIYQYQLTAAAFSSFFPLLNSLMFNFCSFASSCGIFFSVCYTAIDHLLSNKIIITGIKAIAERLSAL